MDEYIKREDALKIIENYSKAVTEEGKVVVDAIRDIIAVITPTANVVPKSEVDRAYERGFERGKKDNVCGFSAEEIAQKVEKIAIELEAMRMAANSYKMHYENARVEVAREIFEEIERVVGKQYNHYVFGNNDFDSIEQDAIINFSETLSDCFAEHKKKYTEGKDE